MGHSGRSLSLVSLSQHQRWVCLPLCLLVRHFVMCASATVQILTGIVICHLCRCMNKDSTVITA